MEKQIKQYLLEKLVLEFKASRSADTLEKNPDDPNTWDIGDIVCGTAGWSMCLPRWYKLVRRTAKQFTFVRLNGNIISGHRNGQWQEVASDDPYDNEEYKARINKFGHLKVDDTYVHLWDGHTPLHGDDMD